MIKKTLGGERIGSGEKIRAELHNYERSTHDLGNVFRSTMAPGVLIPFYKKICTNGDTWTINTNSLIRTMPAVGPLFGTYKAQFDFFEIPIRLYNGVLHNNMIKIGMDMSKVKLPKVTLHYNCNNPLDVIRSESEKRQVASDSLIHYLGIKGIAGIAATNDEEIRITRDFNAVPILAYYDIFKNYYANKQEEKAYVIDNDVKEKSDTVDAFKISGECTEINGWGRGKIYYKFNDNAEATILYPNQTTRTRTLLALTGIQQIPNGLNPNISFTTVTKVYNGSQYELTFNGELNYIGVVLGNNSNQTEFGIDIETTNGISYTSNENVITIKIDNLTSLVADVQNGWTDTDDIYIKGIIYSPVRKIENTIKLQSFKLDNIDDMRISILSNTALNTTYYINSLDNYPYKAIYAKKEDQCSNCKNTMSGLVVKTYQSDIFNNWLSTDWIDGVNGINAISSVSVTNGQFTIDALNLAHKVYNMLNRIAISGGTYEDWQEAVYGEDALRRAESPVYCGGMSGTIAFEEVVSTADTDTATAGDQPLGSLAGKGTLTNVQGGNIEIHIKEPSYIMGIVSITPYIDYCQGNDFDMTELDSLNDIHKPELDEIGFQDLMLERAAWFGTQWDQDNNRFIKHAGGKLPAWIEYMTSVNEVHGDFAEKSKLGYMVLTRDYEEGNSSYNGSLLNQNAPLRTIPVLDWTTYIDPTKFNYQFANTTLEAQNFWVQIAIDATVRRKISAKLIPNL